MSLPYNYTKNLPQSSLSSGYTAGNTTITVQTGDGAKFDAAPFVVAIGDPPQFFLKVTNVSGDTFTVDTTGFDGSTAVSVTASTAVTAVLAAGVLQALLAVFANAIPNTSSALPAGPVPLTGWSPQNASNSHGTVNDFGPDEVSICAGNFAAVQWFAITRSLSVPYTMVATLQFRGVIAGGQSSFVVGFGVSDGTNYEHLGLVMTGASANLGYEVRTMANLSTGGTQLTGPTTPIGPTLTLKITNDGTHRTFYIWTAGAFSQIYQENSGTFLVETLAALTLLDDVGAGGWAPEAVLKYLRIT